ncbi:MAG: hypothetical protein HRT89_12725 [Lentisphaeria bacterium]|nr:hypothetical protein [Lentisphaeria bacterium]NQZ68922.1 hypothetical protein [Lentisphaeria bacterium]
MTGIAIGIIQGFNQNSFILIFACAGLGSCLVALNVSGFFGNIIGSMFYSSNTGKSVEQFSRVDSLIAKTDYEQAAKELWDYIKTHPESLPAKSKMIRLLYEKMSRLDEALDLSLAELNKEITDEHEAIIDIAVDILLEQNRNDEAISLVNKAAKALDGSVVGRKLTTRLRSLL